MFKPSHLYQKLLATFVLMSSTSLFASGGEGAAEHHAPHIENWWNMSNPEAPALGWVMVTFAVFVAILVFATKKEFKNSINKRADDIENAIKEAQKAKEAAMAIKAKYEKKLQDLDGDIAALKTEFAERGETEKQRIIESAQAATEKILKDATATMTAETQRAKVSLKEEASRLAFEIAEEQIKKTISTEDDRRLQANFIQDVMN